MGQRTNGGILGVANIPTTSQAGGVWTLKEVALYKKAGLWPAAATFALSVDSASVNKGGSFTVTLNTTGVSDGTLVPYTITGIASGDLSSGSLTGNFTVTSNTGSLTFTTASSGGTSGNLTATVTCGGDTVEIAIQEADTYFKYVTALLHGDGTNAANNNTFTDSSSNNFTITRNGDTTQGTFTPFSQTGWSNYFSGAAGSDFSIPDSALFEFTGDFTIEAFIYPTALNTFNAILSHWQPGTAAGCSFVFSVNSAGRLVFAYGIGGVVASDVVGSSTTISLNTWTHVLVSRNSGTIRLFVNGTQDATTRSASGTLNNSPNGIYIGSNTGVDLFTGYISNLRVLGGTGVTSVTVPTAPLTNITNTILLTCQSNRFVDNGTANSGSGFAITPGSSSSPASVKAFSPFAPTGAYSAATVGGSAYFDGSGDYLSVSSNAALTFGTSTFTVECWFYITGTIGTRYNILGNIGSGDTSVGAYIHTDGTVRSGTYNTNLAVGSVSVKPNTWYHYAFTWDGTTYRQFINGVVDGTSTTAKNLSDSSTAWYLGDEPFSSSPFKGYLSSLRITKGGALYTSGFTPSTTPPTTTVGSGTVSLLCNFTNAGIIDNAMMNDWITVGDVQVNTTTKKYGTGSIKFDGTGDCLTALDNPNLAYGTGDFTVEFWVYPTSNPSNQVFVDQRESTPAGAGFSLECGSDLKPVVATSVAVITSSTAMTANTWQHIAYSRSGTSLKLFLNGTQVGSATNSSNLTSQRITLGAYTSRATSFAFGYIDDLRITKGYARYTSNFTAPTGPFQDR